MRSRCWAWRRLRRSRQPNRIRAQKYLPCDSDSLLKQNSSPGRFFALFFEAVSILVRLSWIRRSEILFFFRCVIESVGVYTLVLLSRSIEDLSGILSPGRFFALFFRGCLVLVPSFGVLLCGSCGIIRLDSL